MENKRSDIALPNIAEGEGNISFGSHTVSWYRHAAWFSMQMVESGTIPFQDPKKAFAVLCKGEELGLQPFAAWSYLYMTKAGRLAIMTKGALAVCQASAAFESYKEWIEFEGEDSMKAVAVAKRRGQPEPTMKEFSVEDAKGAGLTKPRQTQDGRTYDSIYASYLKDMLLSRARGRALDIAFADVLGGIPLEGVAEDADREEAKRHPRLEAPAPPALLPPRRDPILEKLGVGKPAALTEGKPAETELAKLISDQVDEVLPVSGAPAAAQPKVGKPGVTRAARAKRAEASPGPAPGAGEPAVEPEVAFDKEKPCIRCAAALNPMGGCDNCGWPGRDLR